MVVAPIAFVTEHVETLYEISILFAEDARKAGLDYFKAVPALDGHPLLIEALADLVDGHRAEADASWGELRVGATLPT